mgnify:FL=1
MGEVGHQAALGKALVQGLRVKFPDVSFREQTMPVDETVVIMPASLLIPAVKVLMDDLGIWHLSTITADVAADSGGKAETGELIRLLYHFWCGEGVTLCVELPGLSPEVTTLTGLIPGAAYYEREIYEMFGVTFDGHPDLRPLFLPDDWNEEPPMRDSTAKAAAARGDP